MSMEENAIITIDGRMEQTHGQNKEEPEQVRLIVRGYYAYKDGNYFISYKESADSGFEGCTTTLKISEDARRVAMLRFGPSPSQLIIEKGTRHVCHYETGYGALTLGVAADEISQQLDENGGEANFSYTLDSNTTLLSRNLVHLTVRRVGEPS